MSDETETNGGAGEATGQVREVETVEDMVRRALEDEAASYRPSDWSWGSRGVRERIDRRRRKVRGTLAVTLATAGTAAAALLGVIVAGGSGPAVKPAAGGAGAIGVAGVAKPAASAAASASGSGAGSASRSAQAGAPLSAGASPSASQNAISWPTVRIVPVGRTIVFEHQIWLELSPAERCSGMGLPRGGYGCKSVTDGNQPQGTVSMQLAGDIHGMSYSPLYIGPGAVARMAITVNGIVHPVTVVKLAGHPGYATGYLWLPAVAADASDPRLAGAQVTVYDASGAVLASFTPPTFPAGSPSH